MMAVHLPLSEVSQYEAREIMASDKNVLKPGSGDPTITSKLLDIILGVFWVTKIREGAKGEGMHFPGPNSAKIAMDYGALNIHAKINVLGKEGTKFASDNGNLLETTVGRIIFNEMLPVDYPYINEEVGNGKMQTIVDDLIARYGVNDIAPILDKIKDFGFEQATKSGTTWGIDDVIEPAGKQEIVDASRVKVAEIESQYSEGLISDEERHRMIIEVWHGTKGEVEKLIPATIDPKGSVYDMVTSGARGSLGQITNMAGMKGLIVNSQGETIETPIISSGKSGLSPIEYFITTYGSRKGLTDTALNTAKAGYLTRRLFDVAQDVIITEHDCGTKKSVLIEADSDSGIIVSMSKKVRGRTLANTLKSEDGTVNMKKGHVITKLDANAIEAAGITSVEVKSPMTCETTYGVCAQCYGTDLGNDEMIDLGEAVGTIAAQAIGEPGTQLTMRTFHAGGTASVGGDITQGLPRVEEIFERRKPKTPAIIAKVSGMITDIVDNGKDKVVMVAADNKSTAKRDTEYVIPHIRMCLVKAGDTLEKGQLLTDGSVDLQELFKYAGKERTQDYVISQVNKIYELQGASVSRKHIEVIIRQMFSRARITDSGDTPLTIGEVVDVSYINEINNIAKEEGKKEAQLEQLIMGISEVSLTRRSFLSSASFQHTSKILISHAVKGSKETMRGLKENVILGRLIPAGTGFAGSKKQLRAAEVAQEEKDALSKVEE